MQELTIVYLNGSFVPRVDAKISILDRGFLFADGSYEVLAVVSGRAVDTAAHLARLSRSLDEIKILNPFTGSEFADLSGELLRRNHIEEGLLYVQVTRGVAERDFSYPDDIEPTVLMFTIARNISRNPSAESGARVVTAPDLRWKRRDIKSVALLAQVMSRQRATAAGASEAWMYEDGYITEGTSCSAFIVKGDRIITRPLSTALLPSITRRAVMRLAEEQRLTVEERAFTIDEALSADEAFHTSASVLVMPVVAIDGKAVGSGRPGPMTLRLRQLYLTMANESRST